jgi:hypothetical protein
VAVIGPDAWVVDDTGFPKDGTASPGVARQYSGTLGKVGNCQIGVSISAVTDAASCPLNWRLFLPERWDDACAATPEAAAAIRARRARAAIPDEVRHREKWRLALDMLDELAGWELTPPLVVADAGYGNSAEFRDGITRGHAPGRAGPAGQDPLADRTRLPRTEDRPGPGPLRGPHQDRLAPPRHPGHRRPAVRHPAAHRPKSGCAGLTLHAVLRELQALLTTWTGTCIVCGQRVDTHPRAPT